MMDTSSVFNYNCLHVADLHVEREYSVIQASDATTGMEYWLRYSIVLSPRDILCASMNMSDFQLALHPCNTQPSPHFGPSFQAVTHTLCFFSWLCNVPPYTKSYGQRRPSHFSSLPQAASPSGTAHGSLLASVCLSPPFPIPLPLAGSFASAA